MNIIVNAWGQSGLLNVAPLISMAGMGMLSECEKIIVRPLCLNTQTDNYKRFIKLADAYRGYSGNNKLTISTDIDLSKLLLAGKVNVKVPLEESIEEDKRKLLALGCSKTDILQNIDDGLCSNTRLGEVFFSNEDALVYIYTADKNIDKDFFQSDVIIINTGDFTYDSTAISFIPLESKLTAKHISGANHSTILRYNVLNGPSVRVADTISMHNPEPFGKNGFGEIDLFDIPKQKEKITKAYYDADKETRCRMYGDLANLGDKYSTLFGDNYDYRGATPEDYPQRFAESLSLKFGDISAVFVNMKTDGTKILPLDTNYTSQNLQSRVPSLNVVNLLSSLSIIEIAENYDKYRNGGVYGFASSVGDKFTLFNLFDNEKRKKLLKFFVTGMVLKYCIKDDISLEYKSIKKVFDEYYYNVICVFREIDCSSELTDFNLYSLYNYLDSVERISSLSNKDIANQMVNILGNIDYNKVRTKLCGLENSIQPVDINPDEIVNAIVSACEVFFDEVTK